MEDLFEFLFGASGRISRAEYWRSLVIYCVAGLFVAVILLTAAGLAAPFFIVMVVLVLIPWLMWGFAIHTERLHDRDKSAWWLVMFFLLPGALDQIAKLAWFGGAISAALHFVLARAGPRTDVDRPSLHAHPHLSQARADAAGPGRDATRHIDARARAGEARRESRRSGHRGNQGRRGSRAAARRTRRTPQPTRLRERSHLVNRGLRVMKKSLQRACQGTVEWQWQWPSR